MSNAATVSEKTGNILTPRGRILWNSMFQPRKAKPGKTGKYEMNIAFPKDADLSVLHAEALEAGKAKFSKEFKAANGKWPSSIKSPFKKSSTNDKLLEISDDFPNFLAARDKDRPGLVWPNGKKTMVVGEVEREVQPEDVYAGRWARMSVQCYGYDTEGNKGVTFGLVNVQLLDEGEELVIGGGRVSAESEFEGVGDAGGSSAGAMFE